MEDNDGKKDDVHGETHSPGEGPKEGSVDPNAPLDESLYSETGSAGKPPKDGSIDTSGPTDESHDKPE